MTGNKFPRPSAWRRWRWLFLTSLAAASLLLAVCVRPERSTDMGSERRPVAAPDITLNVALYEYVPQLPWFKEVINTTWTTTGVNYVSWDCYKKDPSPSELDVFVFDGIFLSHFASQGFLRPFQTDEIDNRDDFLPYAIDGAAIAGTYYALPQIGCTNILYYRAGDTPMAGVKSLADLYGVVGKATYTYPQPPRGKGFMMDFSGGTTSACNYIVAYESLYNAYSVNPPLPSASNLDPKVLGNLTCMVEMAGPAQAAYYDPKDDYVRGTWFGEGYGRAMVGFTESMSHMTPIIDAVAFKEMPMGGSPGFSLFYVDVVGVSADVVGTEKEKVAVQFANFLASSFVIVRSFQGAPQTVPQYLMPVRTSVFQQLGAKFPQYKAMQALVQSLNPRFFRLGPNSRNWLKLNKDGIQQQILGEAGVCALDETTTAPKD